MLGACGIGAYGYSVQSASGFTAGAAIYAAAVAFVFLGPIGWKIGDLLRRYAMPEAVFVQGGFWELVQNRLFWQLGPQFIGMAAVGAILVYAAIVLAPPSTTTAVAENPAIMPVEAPTSAIATSHKTSPAEQVSEAFALAYGTEGSAHAQVGNSAYTYTPTDIEGQAGLIQLGDRLALVSDGHEDNQTGAAQGLVSVHYFQRQDEQLRVIGDWPNLSQAGSNGRIYGASLQRDLLQDPVLMVRGGWMGQGCSVDFVELIELTAQAPILRASVQTGYSWSRYDDEGNELPPTELSSTIARTSKGFKVVYTGEVSRSVEYVKRGDNYVPTTPIDDLPGC